MEVFRTTGAIGAEESSQLSTFASRDGGTTLLDIVSPFICDPGQVAGSGDVLAEETNFDDANTHEETQQTYYGVDDLRVLWDLMNPHATSDYSPDDPERNLFPLHAFLNNFSAATRPSTIAVFLSILPNPSGAVIPERVKVLGLPGLPVALLRGLAPIVSPDEAAQIAKNPDTPPDVLTTFATHTDIRIRSAVAEHLSTPTQVLETLTRDKSRTVRRHACQNPHLPPHLVEMLATHTDVTTREGAAGNPTISYTTLDDMVKNPPGITSATLAYAIINNPNVSIWTLESLTNGYPPIYANIPIPKRSHSWSSFPKEKHLREEASAKLRQRVK